MTNRTLQTLFASTRDQLLRKRRSVKDYRAIDALSSCRTPQLGTRYYQCDHEHRVEQYHSCRHRSCYLCAQRARRQWINRQQSRLFDTPHFHVVFTLPHDYLTLWRYNEAWFTGALFEASQRSLQALLIQQAHGGYRPGILMSLHTWGRQLNLHPHIHSLVSAGGINGLERWSQSGEYLLPIEVLKRVYRGKLQALIKQAYREGRLRLPPTLSEPAFEALHGGLYKKPWSVRIEARYAHGRGVLLYLARYCRGGPLNPDQLLGGEPTSLKMRYFDHRTQRHKVLSLSAEELCERLLWHVPARGVHTIRYYGLYASAAKCTRGCLELPPRLQSDLNSEADIDALLRCRRCGSVLHYVGTYRPSQAEKGNSLNKVSALNREAGGSVQPIDQADIACIALLNSS